MADNLEIFGETYPNATGIKAKDTNGNTQTFVKPSGTVNITSSGTTDVSAYANASVAAGTATAPASITGTGATVSTGTNTLTLSKTVSVTPSVSTAGYISSGTAGNSSVSLTASVNTRSSSSLSADGATVTAPAGYYASDASKSVSTMTLPTSTSASATSGYTSKATVSRSTSDQYINIPTGYNTAGAYYKVNAVANGSATAPATISGSSATVSTGTNTLTLTKTVSVTPSVTAGYVSSGTAGNSSVSLTASVTTKGAATITPSTTQQTIASGTYLTGTQTIDAMPSGTAGTPTATKGTVSNHSVTVTPSVTNTTGYITGGTKTGTGVTVSVSELESGTKTIESNGTGISVSGYSTVDVAVPSSDPEWLDVTVPSGVYTTTITTARAFCAAGRSNITTLNAPSLTTIQSYGFMRAGFSSLSAPNAQFAAYGQQQFKENTALTMICLPKATNGVYNQFAYGCTALTTVDLKVTGLMQTEGFRGCTNLTTIILRHTSVVTLGNINWFNQTPFQSGGTGGTIYVPSALVNSYKSASNWTTVNGYGTITWTAIEGSQYQNYYADGTAVS